MPDLMLIQQQQCKTLSHSIAEIGGYLQSGLGSERHWPACTCPAYKFARHGKTNFGGRMVPNPCKHIHEYHKSICGWHQAYSMEGAQTEAQKKNMICPVCGDKTEWVEVGI